MEAREREKTTKRKESRKEREFKAFLFFLTFHLVLRGGETFSLVLTLEQLNITKKQQQPEKTSYGTHGER